ncbi:MAG: NAD(P)H-hydrate dehydratase, partial [Actinobacteria bacterium]|nr:NAD(P)H-hydrate dehydratase [Actinomycetota bacterium]
MTEPEHWDAGRARPFLRVPDASSDKYRRGVLTVRTGSSAYPGAAVLGVEAAWRSGVGMVRYAPPSGDAEPRLGLPTPAAAVLAARPETVFLNGHGASDRRSDAWLIGSGTDPAQRSFAEREEIRALLIGPDPIVLDAGALIELCDPPVLEVRAAQDRPAPLAITPHRGEFLTIFAAAGLGTPAGAWARDHGEAPSDAEALEAALLLADRLGVTVLL